MPKERDVPVLGFESALLDIKKTAWRKTEGLKKEFEGLEEKQMRGERGCED